MGNPTTPQALPHIAPNHHTHLHPKHTAPQTQASHCRVPPKTRNTIPHPRHCYRGHTHAPVLPPGTPPHPPYPAITLHGRDTTTNTVHWPYYDPYTTHPTAPSYPQHHCQKYPHKPAPLPCTHPHYNYYPAITFYDIDNNTHTSHHTHTDTGTTQTKDRLYPDIPKTPSPIHTLCSTHQTFSHT